MSELPDILREQLPEDGTLRASLLLPCSPDASIGESAFAIVDDALFFFTRDSPDEDWRARPLHPERKPLLKDGEWEGTFKLPKPERGAYSLTVPNFELPPLREFLAILETPFAPEVEDDEPPEESEEEEAPDTPDDDESTEAASDSADTPAPVKKKKKKRRKKPVPEGAKKAEPQAPAEAPAIPPELAFDEEPIRVRRAWLPIALVLLAIGGIAVAVYFVLQPEPRLNTAIIAITPHYSNGTSGPWWDGSDEASLALTEDLREHLDALGFSIYTPDDEAEELLASAGTDVAKLREVARELEVGIVILGDLRVTHAQSLLDDEIHDHYITLELALLDTTSDDPPTPVFSLPLRFLEDARSEDSALTQIASRANERAIGPLVTELASLPNIARLRNSTDLTPNEEKASVLLEPFFLLADAYPKGLETREAEEDAVETKRLEDEFAPLPRTRISPILNEEYFIGESPTGRLLLMVDPHFVYMTDSTRGYEVITEFEQLVSSDTQGADRKPLFEQRNFNGIPQLSHDGSTIALLAYHRRYARSLIFIDSETGESKRTLYTRRAYYALPSPSPDGSQVALLSRTCRRRSSCPSELIVAQDDDTRRTLVPSGVGKFSRPAWTPDASELIVGIEPDAELESIWSIRMNDGSMRPLLGVAAAPPVPEIPPEQATPPDPSGAREIQNEPPAALIDPRYTSSFGVPIVSADGSFLIVREAVPDKLATLEGRHFIGRYDLETRTYTRLIGLWPDRFELSPDGRKLAIQTDEFPHEDDPSSRDLEIVIVHTDGTTPPESLTLNSRPDKIGGWSRDSKHLYIHQGSRDSNDYHFTNRIYRVTVP